ncbi:MAG TPA: DUF4402 domain-containing protein [Azospirillaceae bacterium]|nr:DUF4402 domain-containing protein [Azospirillaceae bacterium]
MRQWLQSSVLLVLGGAALLAAPALAATANFNATAMIIGPINVAPVTQLSFGSLFAGASAGTVTIDASGNRNTSGGVTAGGGSVSAASFTISGQASQAYTITLPAATNLTSGANTMPISIAAADLSGGSTTRVTDAGGNDSFSLGGTLSVGANQAPGSYAATLTITVNH